VAGDADQIGEGGCNCHLMMSDMQSNHEKTKRRVCVHCQSDGNVASSFF
jgi:hypothetical protein